MRKISLILMTFVFLSINIYSQSATIRGFVYNKATGEPILFTNVYLAGTSYGSSTDINGYFVITGIKPGTYTLKITTIGYDTLQEEINLKAGDIITRKYYLSERSINLQKVEVTAMHSEDTLETKTSVIKLTAKQVSSLPSIGMPDIAQYIQVLPGVIFTGDQGGQLYIRGGSPVQNKMILDGITVYNPFHSIGLFSVIETELIRNADIYTGGFNAEYGDRISSIMDINFRDGNARKFSGMVGLSTFGANVLLEGPIIRNLNNDPNKGTLTFVLSAKNSYLPQSSKVFYKYIEEDGLPFDYQDFYGKITYSMPNGSKIFVNGFNFNDHVKYSNIADFKWKSNGIGTNFFILPEGNLSLLNFRFSYSDYVITLTDPTNLPKESDINGFNLGLNITNYFQKNSQINYGIELYGYKTDFQYYTEALRLISQVENTTEIGVFVKGKIFAKKFIIEPGFRFQYYGSLSEVSPEPRLALKYNLSDKFRIKFAAGLYSQNLISASDDRDVVNLFYGFLSGSDNLPDTYKDEPVNSRLQKAQHIILGFEINPNNYIAINIEPYFKNFSILQNLNRNKIYDDIEQYSDKPDELKKDFIIESGDAWGVDVSVKYEKKSIYIWIAYSLGFIHRDDGYTVYPPHYDRRHNLNFLSTYKWGKLNNNEVSLRWNFGSGFAFTQNAGYYPQANFSNLNNDILSTNDILGILYGDINNGRLPTYHRLDISYTHKFHISETVTLDAVASISNVYNRKNIFYIDRITGETVYQLPVMPSISLSMRF